MEVLKKMNDDEIKNLDDEDIIKSMINDGIKNITNRHINACKTTVLGLSLVAFYNSHTLFQ